MGGNGGVAIGVRLFDLSENRVLAAERLARSKKKASKLGDRVLPQGAPTHNITLTLIVSTVCSGSGD